MGKRSVSGWAAAPSRCAKRAPTRCRWRPRWRPRMPKGSCIAISSPRTSSSRRMGASRFSISAWPSCSTRRRSEPGRAARPPCRRGPSRGWCWAPWRTWRRSRSAGLAADARSDIFSFGAVLYETLSGTAAVRRGSDAGDDGSHSCTRIQRSRSLTARGLPIGARANRLVVPREESGRAVSVRA